MNELISSLKNFVNKSILIRTEPEIIDFTIDRPCYLVISDNDRLVRILIPFDLKKFKELIGFLNVITENDDILIIGWNIKSFFSLHRFITGKDFKPKGALIDLKLLERYIGVDKNCPEYLEEAKLRLTKISTSQSWIKLKQIYKKIFIPLLFEVIPYIETTGIVNKETKSKLYSCYDICGQIHGRLKCTLPEKGFNPHTLSDEDKINIKPPTYEESCLWFDYRHMEVSVLQWLSDDEYLGNILRDKEKDVFEQIWEIITGIDGKGHREHGKSIFLPVVFGMGSSTLAKKLQIKEEFASKLINKVYNKFSKSFNWVKNQQDLVKNGLCSDIFGRIHYFDELYKTRNFIIQSPAALICLDKLVKLHKGLNGIARIGMHIHDGYVLFVNKENEYKAEKISKEILESDDEMYKGLILKTTCKKGNI